MRKFLAGLALLAPTLSAAQQSQIAPSGAPTVGFPVTAGDGQRATIVQTVPSSRAGVPNPAGTSSDPIYVSGGGGGGGGNGNTVDVQGTGTLDATTVNSNFVIPLTAGRSSVGTRVSGLSGSGATVTVERTNDGGTTWTNANTTESSATGSLSSTLTADGQPRIGAAGATAIRFRVSVAGTGTISIAYNATTGTGPIFFTGYLPGRATADGLIIGGVDNRTIVGNTISTNAGNTDVGTQRVVLANNQPLLITGGSAGTSIQQGTGASGTNAQNVFIGGQNAALNVTSAGTDNITQIGGAALTLGQKTQAASIPVTLASDGAYSTSANQTNGTQIARATTLTPGGAQAQVLGDATGALVPSSFAPVSTLYNVAASTITAVGAAANAGQPGVLYKFQLETAPTANLYICYAGQSTTCSATVHDDMILSSAGNGARLNYENPLKTAVYVFSTAAVTVNVTRSPVN